MPFYCFSYIHIRQVVEKSQLQDAEIESCILAYGHGLTPSLIQKIVTSRPPPCSEIN
jgi:hypothetical protein